MTEMDTIGALLCSAAAKLDTEVTDLALAGWLGKAALLADVAALVRDAARIVGDCATITPSAEKLSA